MAKVIKLKQKDKIDLKKLQRGEVHHLQFHLSDNSLGVPWRIPLIIIRGKNDGPTLGITAAIHGNELNGISTIFKLKEEVKPEKLSGNIIMAPVCNLPGFLNNRREYSDGVDLNRIMPGKEKGTPSEIYAHFFTHKIIKKFDYLLDLHTASEGRVNSLYIRADLENEETKNLAYLQNPQIIVQKFDEEGTLRGWASAQGIPSITVEVGNPNIFQETLVDESLTGIKNTLVHLKMLKGRVKNHLEDTIVCDHSFWIRSTVGGIVMVYPKLTDHVKEGQLIARVFNVYGEVKEEIYSSRSGIVIGKNTKPHGDAGARLLHLGVNLTNPLPLK